MHSELEQLLILQDRQQKIRQIQTEIKTLPLQRNHLESQLAASAAGVEALKQKGRQLEMGRKKLELDVGTRTETISRLKTQQYQTRKNDEFQAIGHEIERYENEIRRLEDEELAPRHEPFRASLHRIWLSTALAIVECLPLEPQLLAMLRSK